jgi:hypothetical protein
MSYSKTCDKKTKSHHSSTIRGGLRVVIIEPSRFSKGIADVLGNFKKPVSAFSRMLPKNQLDGTPLRYFISAAVACIHVHL